MVAFVSFSAMVAELQGSLTRRYKVRLPFAAVVALTRTANAVRQDLRSDMTKIFDRPVAYTLNALRTVPATKQNHTAIIAVKNIAAEGSHAQVKFLGPEIVSGPRRHTGVENVLGRAGLLPYGWSMVPGEDAKRDANGNLSAAQTVAILTALKTGLSGGTYTPVRSARVARGIWKKALPIFVVQPGRPGLKPGVYQRSEKNVLSLYRFVRGLPHYRERFPFNSLVGAHAKEHFETELFKSLSESI
jgi:hypothetical protein